MIAFLGRKLDLRQIAGLATGCAINAVLALVAIRTTELSANQIAIWPGDGVILALMLGVMRRNPILALLTGMCGVISAEFISGYPIPVTLGLAAVNAASIFGVYTVVTRILGVRDVTQSAAFVKFIGVAACGASVTASAVGLTAFLFYHSSFIATFASSLIGNTVGCAVLTPTIVLLTTPRDTNQQLRRPTWMYILSVAAYTLLVALVFGQARYPLVFMIPLGLMAVAYTTSLATLASCVLLTVVVAMASSLRGIGPVALLVGDVQERRYQLQAFMAIIAATSLPMAALMSEHAKLKISLEKSRLDAELANRAKSTFLASISHEIRTPLNGILGMAQVVAMDELTPLQQERIAVIRSSGETLLAILNDVLDLSKIEAGKLTLEIIEFDLPKLLGDTVNIFHSLARNKGVALTLDIAGNERLYLGDPTRLRQILSNLIANAVKFTAAGSVEVSARLEPNEVVLAVRDSGIGIPADKLNTLFDKFTQVDASTTRKFGGTGLGLSICLELVELMQGALTVDSAEGQGSTFTVRLPLTPAAGSAEVDRGEADSPDLQAGLRVLAAEDNATNQLILRTLLQFAGAEVTTVANGQEAVDAWAQIDWDVILMDVQMPVLDGVAATRIIRDHEAREGRNRTPIIALTANVMSHQTDEYLQAGMDDAVAKPICAEDLMRAILTATAERRPRDGAAPGVEAAA